MIEIYEKLSELIQKGIKCAVCTVIATQGSTPRKTGSKMIVCENKTIYGTIGGGSLENHIIDKCSEIISNSTPEVIKLNLSKDLGMKCGGYVEVFIEPVSTPFKLLIFGGGHIGKALSEIASKLSFNTTVIDERSDVFENYSTSGIEIICEKFDSFLDKTAIDNYTFIVIVTKGHQTDFEILSKCIKSDFAYLGVIGSKRKAAELKKLLIQGGHADESDFNKVHIPIGLDIQAEGPQEIAVSIASEIILAKNKILNQVYSNEDC